MNKILKLLPFLLIVLVANVRSEENSGPVDSEKGVLEAVPEKGIRLSEKALKTLEISAAPLDGASSHRIPTTALVYYQDHVGVYRLRNGWYKLIEVKIEDKSPKSTLVRSAGLKPDDEIVVTGVALLRVAEMDAFGGEE